MRIKIEGTEYKAVDPKSGGATILHLIELREHTARLFDEPLGMHRLDQLSRQARALSIEVQRAERDYRVALDDGAGPEQLEQLADRVRRAKAAKADDGMLGLAIIVFLTRRKAGDRVTFAQATNVPIEAIEWIEEPGDAMPVGPDDDAELPDADPFGPEAAPDPTVPAPAVDGSPATPGPDLDPPAAVRVKGSRARKAGRSTTSGDR